MSVSIFETFLLLLRSLVFSNLNFFLVIVVLVARFAEAIGVMRHVRVAALGCLSEVAEPMIT